MVKSEMVQALNKKMPDFQERDVESALNCIVNQMVDALVKGERIEIRGFGSFDLRHRPPRLARNPKTGESVQLDAKAAVHFKPGKEMRNRVDVPCGQLPKSS
ncbi:MAG: integration host factor subunit beta [Candidatus Paceibacterota bacterium]|jgi:integration host factor subunit beta